MLSDEQDHVAWRQGTGKPYLVAVNDHALTRFAGCENVEAHSL